MHTEWDAAEEDQEDALQWDTSWDDDSVEDNFSKQLRCVFRVVPSATKTSRLHPVCPVVPSATETSLLDSVSSERIHIACRHAYGMAAT